MLQITIGLAVIFVTAIIHATTLALAVEHFQPMTRWASAKPTTFRVTIALAVSVLWVMSAHLIEVVLWSAVYLQLGIFAEFEEALYFSLVAYTTLGFGDIILPEHWRLLSGLTAANGFLVFGWSTAFQVDYLASLRAEQEINR